MLRLQEQLRSLGIDLLTGLKPLQSELRNGNRLLHGANHALLVETNLVREAKWKEPFIPVYHGFISIFLASLQNNPHGYSSLYLQATIQTHDLGIQLRSYGTNKGKDENRDTSIWRIIVNKFTGREQTWMKREYVVILWVLRWKVENDILPPY